MSACFWIGFGMAALPALGALIGWWLGGLDSRGGYHGKGPYN